MSSEERIVARERRWQGKIFSVETLDVALPDGSSAYREIVRHTGGAAAAAVRDGRICLVKQYRVALGRETLELPAGKIEAGETGESCAARELKEEAGIIAESLVRIAYAHGSPGFTDEHTEIFLARGLTDDVPDPDEGELIDAVWLPVDEALAMVRCGEITDAKTIIALFAVAGDCVKG